MRGKKLLILGFGGHARSVADIALSIGYEELVFVDSYAKPGERFLQHNAVTEFEKFYDQSWEAFPASGDGFVREKQCELIKAMNISLATLISPVATVRVGAVVREGTLIAHHSHIGPLAKIGKGCIINTGAIVDHEAQVGDYSHVSINATMAGRSQLGRFCVLGASALIIDNVEVCDRVTVGAAAAIVRGIDFEGTYVGVPAKRLER